MTFIFKMCLNRKFLNEYEDCSDIFSTQHLKRKILQYFPKKIKIVIQNTKIVALFHAYIIYVAEAEKRDVVLKELHSFSGNK